jgi:hypothetical protein
MVYTVGIKRKWLPGYTKYRVTEHRTQFTMREHTLLRPRLILSLEDGREIAIANFLTRDFVLYQDYKTAQAALRIEQESEKLYQEEKKIEQLKDDLYDHYQLSLKPPVMSEVVPIQKQA